MHVELAFVFVTLIVNCINVNSFFLNNYPHKIWKSNSDPEIHQNITEIIASAGYKVEEHYVETVDGYILCVVRIRSNIKLMDSFKNVVLLQHGLLDSAHTWVNNLRNQSLGFILADNGFDVWLPNSRGSTYSMKHRSLSPSEKAFWEFTWDHMAKYDLPAVIDFIVGKTGFHKISYIGHSQGTQIALAGFNYNSTLQKHINLFICLAPVAFLGSIKSPIRYVAPIAKYIKLVLEWFGEEEFLPSNKMIHFLATFLCKSGHTPYICSNIIYLIAGFDKANTNQTRLPVYVAHTPAGTSVQNMVHYCQGILSDKFQMFDFGEVKNQLVYNQSVPPSYSLSNLEIPLAIYYGGQDWLADSNDVEKLLTKIDYSVKYIRFLEHYNHLDFVWGLDAGEKLYPSVLEQLSKV